MEATKTILIQGFFLLCELKLEPWGYFNDTLLLKNITNGFIFDTSLVIEAIDKRLSVIVSFGASVLGYYILNKVQGRKQLSTLKVFWNSLISSYY